MPYERDETRQGCRPVQALGFVAAGTITQALADREIATMQAIAEDYRREAARDDLF